ncbi:M56 family metallopeptidase [Mucilaginibacter sabulilitoris]|uniref:M56 family metallopeptidase n=1 Tax=Mucilaginibacter sabulilitoris TaxID=1173583 RepID=A0ABZ0TJD8_9SPHI|nr:M56 family metallopeptidase [Mucilaginibacter sabulilitoris]WPU92542.1 M56 family metallopeptidase [Mucilaginibacter sabulilitoris]
MNWLHYLLEANLYLVVFYAGYQLFLKNETYYTLNRVYLLLSCILSFALPLMQIGILKAAEQGTGVTAYVISTGLKPTTNQANDFNLSIQNMFFYAYLLGVAVLAVILLLKLFKLTRMTRTVHETIEDKYKIIPVEDSNTAFSFFNYLFIGSKTAGSDIIIRHELVHIRQKHTLDVLFLELIKIINWFNPFVYLLQNSIKTVHEYIADEQTAAYDSDALAYSSFLVNNAYGLNASSVTHSFFNYNLLKKRIIMLNQKRSGNLARLKYLVAVPICAVALCASTLGFSKTYALIDLAPQKISDTTKVWSRSIDNKNGVKLDEIGSVVNNKTDFEVTITEKQGSKKIYRKSTASAEDKKLLLDKYGYVFPDKMAVPKPPEKIANMPPPPPPANPAKANKPPKIKKSIKVIDVELVPPPAAPEKPAEPVKEPAEQKAPPPPPEPPFKDMGKFIGKTARYPSEAKRNNAEGAVIIKYNLNNNKQINNVQMVKGIGYGCGDDIVKALPSFKVVDNVKPGNYTLKVNYIIATDSTNPGLLKPSPKAVTDITSADLEVVIVGYANGK